MPRDSRSDQEESGISLTTMKNPTGSTSEDTEVTERLISNPDPIKHHLNIDEFDESLDDWIDVPWYRRPSIFFLAPPFLLFTTAFGAVAVPRLNITLDLLCRQHLLSLNPLIDPQELPSIGGPNVNEQCQTPAIHSLTSTFILILSLISGLLSAITAPRLGSLSDRYGRRYPLCICSFGLLVAEIFTVIVAQFPESFDPNILILGAIIDGLCGSFMLGMALAYSYSSDCTAPTERAMAFAAFQGCLFLGVAVGPAMGGLLIEATGSVLPVFYAVLACHAAFIIWVLLILPESLSERRQLAARRVAVTKKKQRSNRQWVWLKPREILRPLKVMCPPGDKKRSRNLILLAMTDIMIFFVEMGGTTVILLYAERIFGWRNLESGLYLSTINSVRAVVLFAVMPGVVWYFRRPKSRASLQPDSPYPDYTLPELDTPTHPESPSLDTESGGCDSLDLTIIRIAVMIEALGYTFYALSPSSSFFTMAGVITSIGGMASPTIQSALTKSVPREKTGELLGAMALLQSLARIMGPAVFGGVYAVTVGTNIPAAVFWGLAGGLGVAVGAGWGVRNGVGWAEREDGRGQNDGRMVDGDDGEVEHIG